MKAKMLLRVNGAKWKHADGSKNTTLDVAVCYCAVRLWTNALYTAREIIIIIINSG
jgi:hypothetical protein